MSGNIKDQIEQGMKKNTREDKVKFVVCAGGEVGKLHVRKNHTTCWWDVNGLEWRGPRKSTGAGNVSGRWLRVGRAVTCKCWTLDQDNVVFDEVGVEGFPRRPQVHGLLGRPRQVGTSVRGWHKWLEQAAHVGETLASWDECTRLGKWLE